MNTKQYGNIIDQFMPSEDMRDYLKNDELGMMDLVWLICGAPAPVWKKINALKEVRNESMLAADDYVKDTCDEAINDMSEAMSLIDNKEDDIIFTLEDCWYDEDIEEHKRDLAGVFLDYDSAVEYEIREERDEGDFGNSWWELKIWKDEGEQDFDQKYTYYCKNDEIWWFQKEGWPMQKLRGSVFPYLDSAHLCLSVQYKPGDILDINTWPFGPSQPAVLTSDLGWDMLCILIRNVDGYWQYGNIRSGILGRSIYQEDWISPFYNIRKWKDQSHDDMKVLSAVSEWIGGDKERGAAFDNKLIDKANNKSEFTSEEILNMINSMNY